MTSTERRRVAAAPLLHLLLAVPCAVVSCSASSLLISLPSVVAAALFRPAHALHDCVEPLRKARARKRRLLLGLAGRGVRDDDEDGEEGGHDRGSDNDDQGGGKKPCRGGLCVGMKGGPHEGGNASYPVSWDESLRRGLYVRSTMTVPAYPRTIPVDDIEYYIWTDAFFGDAGNGRMNQLVPQLLLGQVLDGSTGPPDYRPKWGKHHTYMFGAHYFFELYNSTTGKVDAHAAYGDLYPASPGETLWTELRMEGGGGRGDDRGDDGDGLDAENHPRWVLSMGVTGDPSRTSTLVVDRPYMGLGGPGPREGSSPSSSPTPQPLSWSDERFSRVCINACWELYGADDADRLPAGGASYDVTIEQPRPGTFPFLSEWEQDEGAPPGGCPSSTVRERHDASVQHLQWDISVDPGAAGGPVAAERPSLRVGSGSGSGSAATGTDGTSSRESLWEEWKERYPDLVLAFGSADEDEEEEERRRGVFLESIDFFERRGGSYVLDETAVLTADEFRELGKASCSSDASESATYEQKEVLAGFACPVLSSADVASSISSVASMASEGHRNAARDGRDADIDYRGTQVTPVKNQGAFGTCWSFAFAETIEGLSVRQGRPLTNVSNQEVIDCCPSCRGSAQDASYGFVLGDPRIRGRLATEDAYPYAGSPGRCLVPDEYSPPEDLAPALVGGCLRVADDEDKTGDPILFALDLLGPGAFGIDASCLRGYAGGVITNCTNSGVNHAILLVGAGTDEATGVPFFRAKNSWGSKWGEGGYFRFARKGGQLGFGSVVFATSRSHAADSDKVWSSLEEVW